MNINDKRLNRNFTKDEIQMVHICVDMDMNLLVIRAMQMTTTVRWYFMLYTGRATTKKQMPGVSILGSWCVCKLV